MTNWAELDDRYLMSTYSNLKLPLAIERGEGNYLFDTEGKMYLDLFTGLAVNVLGHSHPKIVETLKEQGERYLHISNIYLNPPAIRLAKRLAEETNQGKVFFANSGAEATEAFIKLAHKYEHRKAHDHSGFVVMRKSFHGRTLGALRLTRQPHVHQDYPSPDFSVYEVEAQNLMQLEKALKKKPVAFLAEPVLGSAGVMPLSKDYMEEAYKLCRKYNVLFCVDEIQTGLGRTGELFAYQHYDVDPDMILFAKGIGGGLPLGGVIAKEGIGKLLESGDHGTTFAPSPLSAALGNTVLDVLLDDGLLEQSKAISKHLWERLVELRDKHPKTIKKVRGLGFMVGIDLDGGPDQIAGVRDLMRENGILVDITQKTIIRLLPPLTLTIEEADRFIETLEQLIIHLFD